MSLPTQPFRREPVMLIAIAAAIVQSALLILFDNGLVSYESIGTAVTLLGAWAARAKVTPIADPRLD